MRSASSSLQCINEDSPEVFTFSGREILRDLYPASVSNKTERLAAEIRVLYRVQSEPEQWQSEFVDLPLPLKSAYCDFLIRNDDIFSPVQSVPPCHECKKQKNSVSRYERSNWPEPAHDKSNRRMAENTRMAAQTVLNSLLDNERFGVIVA